tara:strand:+ start:287 stop:484 length:198 start_codon:yes stop_codon:yes gene_type:complete
MVSVEPTVEDINVLLQNNTNAAQHLQIVTLQRVVQEQQERIEELETEVASTNGKGSSKNLEKVAT